MGRPGLLSLAALPVFPQLKAHRCSVYHAHVREPWLYLYHTSGSALSEVNWQSFSDCPATCFNFVRCIMLGVQHCMDPCTAGLDIKAACLLQLVLLRQE